MTATAVRATSHIDTATLRELLAVDPPRIVDVRTPVEFETVHIPGSHNVPLDLLRQHHTELASSLDADVILVCRSGARAGQAEAALGEAGLPGLRVLAGGMTDWETAGAPVARGRQTWDLERQVRLTTGSIVAASILGSTITPRLKWVAAAIGTGLVGAAVTNTCAMGVALSKMPWNRTPAATDIATVIRSLQTASA